MAASSAAHRPDDKTHDASNVEKKLFTPGPLCTSAATKAAMLIDMGSRDKQFLETVRYIRAELVTLAGGTPDKYTTVLVQGSGSFAIEAVFMNVLGKRASERKALIVSNGAYADRMTQMCKQAGFPHTVLQFPEDKPMDMSVIERDLQTHGAQYTLLCMVHSETSSGQLNPLEEVARLRRKYCPSAHFFVDAMSSFGAYPISVPELDIHFLVSSANKCLEGVPGFSYVIAHTEALKSCKDNSPSLCLDLVAQWEQLENNNQFRFTPATHTMIAFRKALVDYYATGGLEGRKARYVENNRVIRTGLEELGFRTLLPDACQSYIITTYLCPSDPNFNFITFYSKLSDHNQVIYAGKVTKADCFRIGNIGYLFPDDCRSLIKSIGEVLLDMGVKVPVKY